MNLDFYTKNLIDVENVYKDFLVEDGSVKVIRGVNFFIEKGEFVMICGPSGCGKSTLLNIINGWEPPSQGKVKILGEDLYQKNEDERATLRHFLIAMMHQTPFWVKSLSVLENIAIPYLLAGKSKKEASKRAEVLLELLRLTDYRDYNPVNLSVGQQQRISLLRALINNPRIILADEPTGNLDTKASSLLMSLLWFLNRNLKRTIVMVTHNLELLKYATKIIKMQDGQIKEISTQKHIDLLRRKTAKEETCKQFDSLEEKDILDPTLLNSLKTYLSQIVKE